MAHKVTLIYLNRLHFPSRGDDSYVKNDGCDRRILLKIKDFGNLVPRSFPWLGGKGPGNEVRFWYLLECSASKGPQRKNTFKPRPQNNHKSK